MCGRYGSSLPPEALRRWFGLAEPAPDVPPRYNIAPTQVVPVVRRSRDGVADGAPMGLAGLWERWSPAAQPPVETTFTIITTAANEALRPIHERMPVILPPDAYDLWLADAAPREALEDLLRPYPDAAIAAYPVSRVNRPALDEPGLIAAEPV